MESVALPFVLGLDMIRTIVWFGVGGFFTASYANLVRGLPMWRSEYFCVLPNIKVIIFVTFNLLMFIVQWLKLKLTCIITLTLHPTLI